MGIIAWIVLGLAAGLLANMLIPGKRSQGLILTCLIGIAGALGGGWVATKLFHIHSLHGILQSVHLAHRHRRVSRPAAGLPPGHRADRPPHGTPMNTTARPGPPGQPPAGGRCAMGTQHRHLPHHGRHSLRASSF